MLSVRNLKFGYSQTSFQLNVSLFDMEPGQHTAITGPSGCGKTTFLNIIAGVIAGATGQITFQDEELGQATPQRMRKFRNEAVGFVFQDFRLLEYLSIRDNILLPRTLSTRPVNQDDLVRANQLISRVGLDQLEDRHVRNLSRGEQQRVAVCRALIANPALILADEPTANLDARNSAAVWDLLFDEANAIGATILAVTHASVGLDRFSQVIAFDQLRNGGELCQE